MTSITGTTACIPLIGHPVAPVRTPVAINQYFHDHEIDAVIVPVDIPPERISPFFDVVMAWGNCLGVSVTMPHKPAAFLHVDEATERAGRIGAVNIIRREPTGRLVGDMVDGLAFLAPFERRGKSLKGARCLLIGAGGAGAAIAHALADAEVRSLTIVEIDDGRRRTLADAIRLHYPSVNVYDETSPGDNFDIVVNAWAVGLNAGDPLPFDVTRMRTGMTAADVVTRRVLTLFLKAARDMSCDIQTGEDMALAQLPFQMEHLRLAAKSLCHE